jgi:hypothetical protein
MSDCTVYVCGAGSSGGELFVRVRVGAALPAVLVCWGAWTGLKERHYYRHAAFRLDLHAGEEQGQGQGQGQTSTSTYMYTPGRHRELWDDAEKKEVTGGAVCVCVDDESPV